MGDDDSYGEECEEEEGIPDTVGLYCGDRNKSSERHGCGWAKLPNGDQYDGQYRHGQRHGKGLYVFKNGCRYFGHYRCGIRSGCGIFYYPDGSTYEGNWRKNMKHGYGTYTYPNGDVYKGDWYKDRRHGVGVYIYKQDNICFKGTWKKGVRYGPVEISFLKYKYNGFWDYDSPLGPGIYTFSCKYMLDGYYKCPSEEEEVNLGKDDGGGDHRDDSRHKSCMDMDNMEDDFEGGPEQEGECSLKTKESSVFWKEHDIPPTWYAQNMYKYDYSKLPQEPIPLPLLDSDESVCDLSIEKEMFEVPCERLVCEEEMECYPCDEDDELHAEDNDDPKPDN